MNYYKYEYLDKKTNTLAVVTLEELSKDEYAIKFNKPEISIELEAWMNLFNQAMNQCREIKGKKVVCRIRTNYEINKFVKILSNLDLKKIGGRVEYFKDVKDLIIEENSPIKWKNLDELKWRKEELIAFTREVISNSFEKDENPESFVEDWLSHEELTSGHECISIGSYNNKNISLVVAQKELNSDWCRLSYMGLTEDSRGKGLGKWVHQKGFQMMKDQGGLSYHGGTHSNNLGMRKLFEKHGCQYKFEMEEWQIENLS